MAEIQPAFEGVREPVGPGWERWVPLADLAVHELIDTIAQPCEDSRELGWTLVLGKDPEPSQP